MCELTPVPADDLTPVTGDELARVEGGRTDLNGYLPDNAKKFLDWLKDLVKPH